MLLTYSMFTLCVGHVESNGKRNIDFVLAIIAYAKGYGLDNGVGTDFFHKETHNGE